MPFVRRGVQLGAGGAEFVCGQGWPMIGKDCDRQTRRPLRVSILDGVNLTLVPYQARGFPDAI